jgi:transposase-like protein
MTLGRAALLQVLKAMKTADVDNGSGWWRTIYQALIDAELSSTIGAGPVGKHRHQDEAAERFRPRVLSTPARRLELAIPKLRPGSFFPSLLERRRRVNRALFAVIMEAYLQGVSIRKVDDLVKALGIDSGISKIEASRICADMDIEVAAFRDRSLAQFAYPYVFFDLT